MQTGSSDRQAGDGEAVGGETLEHRLREAGVVAEAVLRRASRLARESGTPLQDRLIEQDPTCEREVWRVLAEYLSMPFDDLASRPPQPELAQRVPSSLAFGRELAPLAFVDGRLRLAVCRPATLGRLDELSALTGLEVEPVLVPPSALKRYVQALYGLGAQTVDELVSATPDAEPTVQVLGAESHTIDETLDSDQQASITRFVNQMLLQAVGDGASDIHIEPYERQLRVRFRIDGQLQDVPVPATIKQLEAAIISRLKVLGNLDIAEKRLSQDGQMRLRVLNRTVDVRVSVLPSIYGESVVLRILDRQTQFRSLDELGLSPAMMATLREVLELAQGLVLVTGPTGSGKTTTLYGSLNHVNRPHRKVVTIEDPVEYRLDGITQVQVKESIGHGFGTLLRHIVRHDPDVVMVGEIRDRDTAQMALNAAMTGHLVFSTLHTNDAPTAAARLLNMGIPPYMIAASLKVVVAQRLVRLICPDCRERTRTIPPSALREFPWLAQLELWRGAGCESCHETGYRGRTALFELFAVTDEISEKILASASASALRQAARAQGMVPLREAGLDLVRQGLTTVDEVYRVTRETLADPAETREAGR